MKTSEAIQGVRDFWEYLTKDYKNNEYCEIRVLPTDKRLYRSMQGFADLHGIYIKKNCQLFFKKKDIDLLIKFLTFNNCVVVKNGKVCYTLNPRKMIDGEIQKSGYENMESVYMLFFDIELQGHKLLDDFGKRLLLDYIYDKLGYILPKYIGIHELTIIDSGNGFHVLARIPRTKITPGRREWYRQFISKLVMNFDNDNYRMDPLKDFTRIFALPFSINPKNGRMVKVIQKNYVVNDWKMPSKRIKKIQTKEVDLPNGSKIEDSLVWQLLKRDIPMGEIHTTLIFALKLLIKNLNVDHRFYELHLNRMRASEHSLDPSKGCEGKTYHKGIVVNWCKRNLKWCNENFKDWRDERWI